MRTIWLALLSACWATSAAALDASDAGTFVAVDQEGQPVEKILRVSLQGGKWKFEDRQPDGSWLDVTCHGGCQHHVATDADIARLFGSPPPPNLKPDCVYNNQYAFCHIEVLAPEPLDRYALIVAVEDGWLPVNLMRVPDQGQPPPAELEAALLR